MAFVDDYDHWARAFPARVARAWRDFLEDIAALITAAASSGDIPHILKGDDRDLMLVGLQPVVQIDGGGAESFRVPIASFIKCFAHGQADATYDPPILAMSRDGGFTWTTWSQDPSSHYIDVLSADVGTVTVQIYFYDGGSSGLVRGVEMSLVVVDSLSLGGSGPGMPP